MKHQPVRIIQDQCDVIEICASNEHLYAFLNATDVLQVWSSECIIRSTLLTFYRPVDFGHHLLKCGIIGFSLIKSAADLRNARFTKPLPLADRYQRGAAALADKIDHTVSSAIKNGVAFVAA